MLARCRAATRPSRTDGKGAVATRAEWRASTASSVDSDGERDVMELGDGEAVKNDGDGTDGDGDGTAEVVTAGSELERP